MGPDRGTVFSSPSHTAAVILALFVVLLWATSGVLIKIGLQEIPALTFAGLRYGLAALALLGALLGSRRATALRSIPPSAWRKLALLGILLYAVTQGAVFLALSALPAVTVNLLWSFSTIVVAAMGIVWLAVPPTPPQWAGVALAAGARRSTTTRRPSRAASALGSSSPSSGCWRMPAPPSSEGK